MEYEALQRHLRRGEAFVALGRQHVARQRRAVCDLKRSGRDASTARVLLGAYRELLQRHEAVCTRIREELADFAVAGSACAWIEAALRPASLLNAGTYAKPDTGDEQRPTVH